MWLLFLIVGITFLSCDDEDLSTLPEINILSPANGISYDNVDTIPIVVELSSLEELPEYELLLESERLEGKVYMDYTRKIGSMHHTIDTFWVNTITNQEYMLLTVRVKTADGKTTIGQRSNFSIYRW